MQFWNSKKLIIFFVFQMNYEDAICSLDFIINDKFVFQWNHPEGLRHILVRHRVDSCLILITDDRSTQDNSATSFFH